MSAGRVAFVGAGPGDPGLLTARALELIAAADVILYDRLIGPAALVGARAEAERRVVARGWLEGPNGTFQLTTLLLVSAG